MSSGKLLSKEELKNVFLSYAGDAKVLNQEQLNKACESLGTPCNAKDALSQSDLNKSGAIDTDEEFDALVNYIYSKN